jgi:hypothetical protein
MQHLDLLVHRYLPGFGALVLDSANAALIRSRTIEHNRGETAMARRSSGTDTLADIRAAG